VEGDKLRAGAALSVYIGNIVSGVLAPVLAKHSKSLSLDDPDSGTHRGSVAGLKYQLHMHPHAADAAIGEIAIQETARCGASDDLLGNLCELRMIERV
jgi:hypothetical protein